MQRSSRVATALAATYPNENRLRSTSDAPSLIADVRRQSVATFIMALTKLKELVLEAPLTRALFHVLSNVAIAVFSGAFVFQISTPAGLEWHDFYRQTSFYGLLITAAAIYWYNKAIYQLDKDVLRFADSEYCIAYVRSKCLPDAAEQYRIAIRTGNKGELSNAMRELKRVLK